MCSMKFRFFGFLTLLLLVPGFVEAGTGRQTTTFLVEADAASRLPLDRAELRRVG